MATVPHLRGKEDNGDIGAAISTPVTQVTQGMAIVLTMTRATAITPQARQRALCGNGKGHRYGS